MIQAQNIAYTIRGKNLLQPISLEASSGEFVAILGANGAGKSTLLKLLSQELKPTQGKIYFNNRLLSTWSSTTLAQHRAVLAQHHTVAFNFTVADLVMMGRYPHFKHSPRLQDYDIVVYCLEKTGIAHLSQRSFLTLSGGEQQRVMLAKVMAQLLDHTAILQEHKPLSHPKFLLLDEPTTGLDIFHQQNLLSFVRQQTQRGLGVIAILHDLNWALQYADKVLLLQQGQSLGFGKPLDMLTPNLIKKAFQIDVQLVSQTSLGFPIIVPYQPNFFNQSIKQWQPQHFH